MTQQTLASRLLAWVIVTLTLIWAAFATVGYRTGAEEADELGDGHLASVAELALGDQPKAYVDEYQPRFTVVVWDADGRLLRSEGPAPTPAFDAAREGFETLQFGSPPTAWRSFSRWSTSGPRRKVTVLVDAAGLDELAWDVAGDIAEPGLWMFPIAVLVLGLVVRRALAPLRELSDDVHALDVRRPTPLPARQRPLELGDVATAIDALTARYQLALQREQQLASELAHELRTPLTSLALQANAMRGASDPVERDAALQRIEHDALRAGDVLTALLALARAGRAELADAAQPLDLVALARGVLAEYAQSALDSGHELSLSGDGSMQVEGHPVLLGLALRNLIDNALAHTGRGTAIEVRIDARARNLDVVDNGAGPAPGPGLSPHTLGLGLGHRVVDKIAAIHQARFGASAPPPGFSSCYRISFDDAAAVRP